MESREGKMEFRWHPMNEKRFHNKKHVAGFEGGAIYTAERDGKYYAIIHEGTMLDMLSEEDAAGLPPKRTIEFETAAERDSYIEDRYGVDLTDD